MEYLSIQSPRQHSQYTVSRVDKIRKLHQMSVEKPTIALIPGAWLSVSSYARLLACLQDAGYSTAHVGLPSLNPEHSAQCSIEKDAEVVRNTLLKPLIEEQGQDVILLMHSYGGE